MKTMVWVSILVLVIALVGAGSVMRRGTTSGVEGLSVLDITSMWAGAAGAVGSSTATTITPKDPNALPPQLPVQTRVVTGGKRMAHERLGFEVTVPESMEIERFDEGSGAETMVFFDAATSQEFQLFVTPYAAKEITKDRLQKDIRSGVVKNMQNIVLQNGMHATTFESEVPGLGATREVWFIHQAHLYEFTVKKEWDTWLSQILATWKTL